MLILIAVLLFCILLAVVPKEYASGIVKGVATCFAVLALGTALFYAWGFYLYESDKAQAVTQYQSEHVEQSATALPECGDPYEPYRTDKPTCEWHEAKHPRLRTFTKAEYKECQATNVGDPQYCEDRAPLTPAEAK